MFARWLQATMGGILCKYLLNAVFCQFKEELQYDKTEFQELTQSIVLLDGATGSNLMAAGMPKGVCTEEWVLAHKDVIQNLQRAYIEAGSNIIYAPTFGGNRVSLTMHGLQDRMEEINRTLVSYSREVADEADHKVYFAADITTSGENDGSCPGEMTYEAAFEMYQEQIGILKDSGVDLIVAEILFRTGIAVYDPDIRAIFLIVLMLQMRFTIIKAEIEHRTG